MKLRTALIVVGLAAIAAISAPAAKGQGRPPQHPVLSDSVLKAMIAHKPKTKKSFTAGIAAMRHAATDSTRARSTHPAPASVREIRKAKPSRR